MTEKIPLQPYRRLEIVDDMLSKTADNNTAHNDGHYVEQMDNVDISIMSENSLLHRSTTNDEDNRFDNQAVCSHDITDDMSIGNSDELVVFICYVC